jgi:hypothetical protein
MTDFKGGVINMPYIIALKPEKFSPQTYESDRVSDK